MRVRRSRRSMRVALVLAFAVALGFGCADDGGGDSTSEPKAPFEGGFLGLADVTTNRTQCAECHASIQAQWEGTRHADAYATIDSIGRAGTESRCTPCHSVGALGNEVTDPNVGFVATDAPELHNVQCESCHGPGAEHVADTTRTPDATLAVSVDIGCGECHQGEHHPFVDEWQLSAHARANRTGASFGLDVAGNPECARCHVAQSFIAWVESDGANTLLVEDPFPITCATCHDPHGSSNPAQLREIAGQPIVCTTCHNQGDAAPGGVPHHPQANMLLGDAGFVFAGFTRPGPAAHGSTDQNAELCATCHVTTRPFQGATEEGEEAIPAKAGHTFLAVPVIDEATGERNFDACLECHANPEQILEPHQARIDGLAAQLQAALDAVPEGQRGSDKIGRAHV